MGNDYNNKKFSSNPDNRSEFRSCSPRSLDPNSLRKNKNRQKMKKKQNILNPGNLLSFISEAETKILLHNLNQSTNIGFNFLTNNLPKKINEQLTYRQIIDDAIDNKIESDLTFTSRNYKKYELLTNQILSINNRIYNENDKIIPDNYSCINQNSKNSITENSCINNSISNNSDLLNNNVIHYNINSYRDSKNIQKFTLDTNNSSKNNHNYSYSITNNNLSYKSDNNVTSKINTKINNNNINCYNENNLRFNMTNKYSDNTITNIESINLPGSPKHKKRQEELNIASFSTSIEGNIPNTTKNKLKTPNIIFNNKIIRPMKTIKIGKKEDFIINNSNSNNFSSKITRAESPTSLNSLATIMSTNSCPVDNYAKKLNSNNNKRQLSPQLIDEKIEFKKANSPSPKNEKINIDSPKNSKRRVRIINNGPKTPDRKDINFYVKKNNLIKDMDMTETKLNKMKVNNNKIQLNKKMNNPVIKYYNNEKNNNLLYEPLKTETDIVFDNNIKSVIDNNLISDDEGKMKNNYNINKRKIDYSNYSKIAKTSNNSPKTNSYINEIMKKKKILLINNKNAIKLNVTNIEKNTINNNNSKYAKKIIKNCNPYVHNRNKSSDISHARNNSKNLIKNKNNSKKMIINNMNNKGNDRVNKQKEIIKTESNINNNLKKNKETFEYISGEENVESDDNKNISEQSSNIINNKKSKINKKESKIEDKKKLKKKIVFNLDLSSEEEGNEEKTSINNNINFNIKDNENNSNVNKCVNNKINKRVEIESQINNDNKLNNPKNKRNKKVMEKSKTVDTNQPNELQKYLYDNKIIDDNINNNELSRNFCSFGKNQFSEIQSNFLNNKNENFVPDECNTLKIKKLKELRDQLNKSYDNEKKYQSNELENIIKSHKNSSIIKTLEKPKCLDMNQYLNLHENQNNNFNENFGNGDNLLSQDYNFSFKTKNIGEIGSAFFGKKSLNKNEKQEINDLMEDNKEFINKDKNIDNFMKENDNNKMSFRINSDIRDSEFNDIDFLD